MSERGYRKRSGPENDEEKEEQGGKKHQRGKACNCTIVQQMKVNKQMATARG